jgi:predicted aspartyl protease
MVVDTGASAVVLPWSIAVELRIEKAASTAPAAPFKGFGKGESVGRKMQLDMILPGPQTLAGVEVYFIEGANDIAGRDGLLGQRSFFERVKLVQLTAPESSYVLEW